MRGFVNKQALEQVHRGNLEFFKENMSWFVETDPRLKLNHKFFSTSGNNFAIEHNSSPRGIMGASQRSNTLTLCETDINTIQTGVDYELGKYSLMKKIERTSEIISVVKRHHTYGSSLSAESLIIYREIDSGIINCIEIPRYSKLHTYFGYENKIADEVENYVRGDIVESGTILASSGSIKEDGSYGDGRNVNVCLMPLEQNDEDGFMVSDEFCEKFKFNLYETRTIEIDEDEFLINQSGDPEKYVPFKELGERINEDGVVFAKRKYDYRYAAGLLSKKDLCEYNPIFDEVVYDRTGGGLVVDVKVFKNPKRRKRIPTKTDELLEKYHASTIDYYKQIIDVYETLNKETRAITGTDLIVGESFNTLIVEAYGMVESARPNSKLKKMYKLSPLSLYRLEIVIEHTFLPKIKGPKFTDFSANKGIITKILPKKDMPRDAFGNVADVIGDIKSTPSRLNGGRLYEYYIKGSMLKVEKLVAKRLSELGYSNPSNITDDDAKELFKIPLGFARILQNMFTDKYENIYSSNNYEVMRLTIINIVEDAFKIYLRLDNEKRKYMIVEELKQSIYAADSGPVTFTLDGVTATTVDDIMIAPMYIIMLNKIADDILTTSSASVNYHGLPVVVNKKDKNALPYKNNPVRTNGETEGRIYVAYGGQELMAELKDMNASLTTHKMVYSKILSAAQPTNIPKLIDRKTVKFGTDRGLEILNTLYSSVGIEIKHVKDKNRYVEKRQYVETDTIHVTTVEDVDAV